MSLWLSGANRVAGAVGGMMGAQMRRQQLAFMRAMSENAERAWMEMVASSMRHARLPPAAPSKRKSRAGKPRRRAK